MSYYQMSIEDIENQKILQAMSDRTAYIDEYGSFGFDFSSTGASKYYILCAVIVENKDIRVGFHQLIMDIIDAIHVQPI